MRATLHVAFRAQERFGWADVSAGSERSLQTRRATDGTGSPRSPGASLDAARRLLPAHEQGVPMLPGTSERVPLHTSDAINDRIRTQTFERIAFYARNPELIEERLDELDREWDIER